jgi:hypothetical protein
LITEFAPQFVGSCWVQFEGDHASTALHERARQRAGTGADVQYEVAGHDAGVINEPFGPPTIESVPSPSCPLPGHGRPS